MTNYIGGGMSKRILNVRWGVLLIGMALACSKNGEEAAGEGGGGPPGGFAMPVEVAVAKRDTVVDALQATGQIEAIQSIELKPEIEGRVTAILVREGQAVGQGTPLFRIDDAELKAQVARAEADWDLANQALKRTRDLLAQNASSAADLEQAEATERSTRAQVDLLKVRQERTTVRAPFGGVVGRRSVSLGDYVTTGTTLISLQTVDPQRAAFQIPERYAEKLQQGQRVQIRVAALQNQEFTGVVDFVDPVVQLPVGRSWSRRRCRMEGASSSPACSSRPGWLRKCVPAPSSFLKKRLSRCRAPISSGWSLKVKQPGARSASAYGFRALSKFGVAWMKVIKW
jgi:membrane fusion protein, multidrug efflux system